MNDGHYTNIRNYLEEIASQQKQLLTAVQRTNELLLQQVSNYSIGRPVNTAATGPIKDDAFGKELKTTTGHVLSSAERAEPTDKPKTATKKGKPKPAVNWNS